MIHKIKAKKISYGCERSYKDIIAIVIHYTGNNCDTAKANAIYFSKGNDKEAGAQYFVDRFGSIYESVPLKYAAYAVGKDMRSGKPGEASYYGKINNYNSVSIELCDIANKEPSIKQVKACKRLVKKLKRSCPNVKYIVRHWDVNGKECPARWASKNNQHWAYFKKQIDS